MHGNKSAEIGLREYRQQNAAFSFRARGCCCATQLDLFPMPRQPRFPNELSKAERKLWQRIRRELAKRTADKRQPYGLRSN